MLFHEELKPFVGVPLGCGIALAYVALGLLGNRLMVGREPWALRRVQVVYNVSQIVVCSIIFWKLLPFFTSAEHGYGVGIEPNPVIEKWFFVFYCCKILDFGDTLFMVLAKKTRQFTFLHVWHHGSIVPLFAFYLSSGRGAGSIAALPIWNSLIHVLMYAHYLVASLGIFKNMWWKPILTSCQIGHHMLIMVYMFLNRAYANPDITTPVFVSGVVWGLSILGLFCSFYVQQYLGSSKRSSPLEPGAKAEKTVASARPNEGGLRSRALGG